MQRYFLHFQTEFYFTVFANFIFGKLFAKCTCLSAILLNQLILYQASSWCGKHLLWFVESIDESEEVQEEEHTRLFPEVVGTTPLSLVSLFVFLWVECDNWINKISSAWIMLLPPPDILCLKHLNSKPYESCLICDFTLFLRIKEKIIIRTAEGRET